MTNTTQTWEAEQIAKLNSLADVDVRARFDGLGGAFWLTVFTDGNEHLNKRFKSARSALKAYVKECSRHAAIQNLIPKTSGRITLRVGRETVLESAWREHAKMWI